jgi:hypothetical protein
VPLSLDDLLVQPANSGSFHALSGTATLPTGTTEGSTVLICLGQAVGDAVFNPPTNFTRDTFFSDKLCVFRRTGMPAGETSWTLSGPISTPALVRWVVYEIQPGALDPDVPVDVSVASVPATNSGTSVGTGTTPQSTTYDGLKLALYGAYNSAGTTVPTFSGHTGGLIEQNSGGATTAGTALGLSVAMQPTQQLGAFSSAATSSMTLSPSNPGHGTMLVYTAAGAKRAPILERAYGFEAITAGGLTAGPVGSQYLASKTGDVTVAATNPRSGARCLRISAAAGVSNAVTPSVTVSGTMRVALVRQSIWIDGSLPAGDVELFTIVPGAGSGTVTVRYRAASQKLGLQLGTGTEVLSDATVSANSYLNIDVRLVERFPDTAYNVVWQLGGVEQAAPASFAASALSSFTLRHGWATAATATILVDDVAIASIAGLYPLGNYQMVRLGPDPAATPSVSGTVGNFALITNNATGAALTSGTLANARDAVDEFPPTVGASADGVCAITGHASDYIEFPMATYDASGTASIRAVLVALPIWAAAATTATCRVLGYDGTTATTLFAEADPSADNSSTPAWICAMWKPTGGWTQAKLDAAAIRYGAADATPDIGPHAVGMEVAIQVAATQTLFGDLATQALDPVTGGVVGVTVDTNVTPGKTADLYYEESDSPTDVPVAADTAHVETIDAPDAPTVNRIELAPEPEPEA